jgi:hypothetical protein
MLLYKKLLLMTFSMTLIRHRLKDVSDKQYHCFVVIVFYFKKHNKIKTVSDEHKSDNSENTRLIFNIYV